MKLNKVELHNFKNIENTTIEFKTNMSAIYGPNGTGKTAVIEAIEVFRNFYISNKEVATGLNINMIKQGANDCSLKYFFEYNQKELCFELKFSNEKSEVILLKEEILYKNDKNNKREVFKNLYSICNENIDIVIKCLNKLESTKKIREDIKAVHRNFYNNRSTALDYLSNLNSSEELIELGVEFLNQIYRNLAIVTMMDQGVQNLKIVVPLSFSTNKASGQIPLFIGIGENKYSEEEKQVFEGIINQISSVFENLVSNAHIILKSDDIETKDSIKYYSIRLVVVRNGVEIAIEHESVGIIKLISILSLLVAYYNDEQFIAVIDELDAHIFEFLLSRLLGVLNNNSKGQLIFTAHNLAPMEALNKDNLILSTFIDNNVSFNYFKKISNTTNMRDKYIRAYSLGSEDNIDVEGFNEYKLKNSLKVIKTGG